jgi:tryptophanyl-tRNA synthetase
MFHEIKRNIANVDTIYILLAEAHAEISQIDKKQIEKNAIILADKINALFRAFINVNDIKSLNLKDKIKFIFQNYNETEEIHKSLTYSILPIINTSMVINSPIYKESKNNSLAFLLYPILQTVDVLLYAVDKDITVFVSGDQQVNINIMKDIFEKLKLKNHLNVFVYDNVIYDYSCKEKMSKSLNNYVDFDDIDAFEKYCLKYKSYPRLKVTDKGNYKECSFYQNIIYHFNKFLNINVSLMMEMCNTGNIGCYNCKDRYFLFIRSLIKNYQQEMTKNHDIYTPNLSNLLNNYEKLNEIINRVRIGE